MAEAGQAALEVPRRAVDRGHDRAVTLEELRGVFHGPLMGNCGYDAASAEDAVARGAADMIAFGRPYISNPDLVERLAQGWPLAPEADPSTWYSGDLAATARRMVSTELLLHDLKFVDVRKQFAVDFSANRLPGEAVLVAVGDDVNR